MDIGTRIRRLRQALNSLDVFLDSVPEEDEEITEGQEALASSFHIDDPELVEMLIDIPRLEEEQIGALKIVLRNFLGQVRPTPERA